MKRSTKITTIVIIFFVIVAAIIGGRYAMKIHFQKKFGKRPDPGVVVVIVKNKNFSQKIESYGTALSNKTSSFRIKKSELLKPNKLMFLDNFIPLATAKEIRIEEKLPGPLLTSTVKPWSKFTLCFFTRFNMLITN